MGNSIADIATELPSAGADAIGINCSSGLTPGEIAHAIEIMHATAAVPIALEMNATVIDTPGGQQRLIEPDEFVRHMLACREKGARILGGCCKTAPEYIRALAQE